MARTSHDNPAACLTAAVIINARMQRLPYPVCVVISECHGEPMGGVDDASMVHEWIELDGSTSLLAVFTEKPGSQVGPVGPLSLPKGPAWFHIVTGGSTYRITAGPG